MMIAILYFIALWDYSYDCSINFTYDNNIFNYSQNYIDDFMGQIRPYRFPFETYDDFCTGVAMDILIRNKFFNERTTTLNLGVYLRHYAINEQKDFQRLDVGLRQSFGSWALKGSYRIIPRYLIRYYRDQGGTYMEYIPCNVRYHTLTGKITLPRMARFSSALMYHYSIDDYVEAFDIYDARAHAIGLQSTIELSRTLQMDVGYDLKSSSLDTIASTGPSDDEEVPDGAYLQQTFEAGIELHGLGMLPLSIIIGYRYTFRNYRTDDPDDRMHFSRRDHQHRLSLNAELKVRSGIVLSTGFFHNLRNATSEAFPRIDSIKDFNQDRLSAGLKFYY
jgi:hypothetical protein